MNTFLKFLFWSLLTGVICFYTIPVCGTIQGKASYYGNQFHRRKTASGEIFNQYDFTCAHKTLPFGTLLLVTNLHNNKQVIVRVNDRGPFHKDREIDLSLAAAKYLDLLHKGIGHVKIEIIDKQKIIEDNKEYCFITDFSDDKYKIDKCKYDLNNLMK